MYFLRTESLQNLPRIRTSILSYDRIIYIAINLNKELNHNYLSSECVFGCVLEFHSIVDKTSICVKTNVYTYIYIKFIKCQFCSETDAAATATIRKNNNDRQTKIWQSATIAVPKCAKSYSPPRLVSEPTFTHHTTTTATVVRRFNLLILLSIKNYEIMGIISP